MAWGIKGGGLIGDKGKGCWRGGFSLERRRRRRGKEKEKVFW